MADRQAHSDSDGLGGVERPENASTILWGQCQAQNRHDTVCLALFGAEQKRTSRHVSDSRQKSVDFSTTSSVHTSLHFGLDGLLRKRSRAFAHDLGQRVSKKLLVGRVGKR
jgi:hypothetical protein